MQLGIDTLAVGHICYARVFRMGLEIYTSGNQQPYTIPISHADTVIAALRSAGFLDMGTMLVNLSQVVTVTQVGEKTWIRFTGLEISIHSELAEPIVGRFVFLAANPDNTLRIAAPLIQPEEIPTSEPKRRIRK